MGLRVFHGKSVQGLAEKAADQASEEPAVQVVDLAVDQMVDQVQVGNVAGCQVDMQVDQVAMLTGLVEYLAVAAQA